MLFKEIIAVYSENSPKHTNAKWKEHDCRADGMYIYHLAFEG
jgi:hypothetical protein